MSAWLMPALVLLAAHRLHFFGANAALADLNAFAWGRMDVYLSLVY